ncbi:hypothetical protein [Pelagicoccus mobilis]|uniref:Uncharacterized protein n=1 Tax=Pelagicoccus mobilis TaxID=415221 RepID=A0A934VMM2_9BACT|nr:hypothetical protein [Pelagicoccus mobilis]MBK1875332.1 hypothetical protein [Pelagicoccus mobilis]
MNRFLFSLSALASCCLLNADDVLGPYIEKDGIVIFEAENTESEFGLWTKKTEIEGHQGDGYIEFGGNSPASGPANSPLEYEFKITKPGLYRLHLHCARVMVVINGENRHDVANDGYVRVEGDYGEGPNAGNEHGDDGLLSLLKKNTKFFGGKNREFVWASGNRLDPGGHNNKRKAVYDFKAGETYKLVLSGRSQLFKVDRIMFRHMDVPVAVAEDLENPESLRDGQKIGFQKYAEESGLIGGLSGDDDNDGLSNFYEFSVGGDPSDFKSRGFAPKLMRAENGALVIRTVERQKRSYRGVNYTLQMREHLGSGEWTSAGEIEHSREQLAEKPDFEEVILQIADASSLPAKAFFRVKIEEAQ